MSARKTTAARQRSGVGQLPGNQLPTTLEDGQREVLPEVVGAPGYPQHQAHVSAPTHARELPSIFLPDTRIQPDLAGHSRTTTKGHRLTNAEVRGPFQWVAGAGFEPA